MLEPSQEIFITAIIGAISMFGLSFIVVIAIVRYKNRSRQLKEVEQKFQQEVLKVSMEIKEQTLKSISEEIHDNVGQILSLAKLYLGVIENENEKNRINQIKELVGKAIHDLRDMSHVLNSAYISNKSLKELIEHELEILRKSGTFKTSLNIQGIEQQIETKRQLVIFRIIQELLNNVIKHSKANVLTIQVDYLVNQLVIQVEDNGIGFDTKKYASKKNKDISGIGLSNLFTRAEILEGSFQIESQNNGGTKAKIKVPYKSSIRKYGNFITHQDSRR